MADTNYATLVIAASEARRDAQTMLSSGLKEATLRHAERLEKAAAEIKPIGGIPTGLPDMRPF